MFIDVYSNKHLNFFIHILSPDLKFHYFCGLLLQQKAIRSDFILILFL